MDLFLKKKAYYFHILKLSFSTTTKLVCRWSLFCAINSFHSLMQILQTVCQCFGQKEIKESDPEPSADNAGSDRG
jgi:Mn-dependent DtxR family transcriptional regulator